MRSRRIPWTYAACLVLAALGLAWLLDAAGHGLPAAASRTLAVAGLAAAATLALRAARRAPPALLVLVAISLGIRFVGLDFELVDHWYNDEGGFRAAGEAINAGRLLPATFHYGHLLYYLSAFVLWLESLFPDAAASLTGLLYETPGRLAVRMALLRSLTALLGALTTIPVYVAARRIAGPAAGVVGGLLIACSSLYNSVAQLVISDVPAGFFGAMAVMFAARLLDGENRADYLLAGVMAALAAASKYPAGLTALAIVGVWLHWRLRRRDLNALLLLSGLVSLATFLLVMPALWLRPGGVFVGSGLDILFGLRQYARGGWLGVQPESNLLWYGERLLLDLGPPAWLAGLTGLAALPSAARRRAAAMAPFGVLYLALIVAMSMAVHRNLQPLLPLLAALLGAGIVAWPLRLERRRPAAAPAAFAALVVACALWPAARVLARDYAHTRPGTRELMESWIERHVPAAAGIVVESHTPWIDTTEYDVRRVPFAAAVEPRELRSGRREYLLLSGDAWGRFQDPELWSQPHHPLMRERYEELRRLPLVAEYGPAWNRAGPLLTLHRLPEPETRYRKQRRFLPGDACHLSDPALAGGRDEPIRFYRRGQSAAFKERLAAGEYRLSVRSRPRRRSAWVWVAGLDGGEVGTFRVEESVRVELPSPDEYIFRIFLPPRSSLLRLAVRRLAPSATGGG